MIARVTLALVLLMALVGCRGKSNAETTHVRAYFLRDGNVWPVQREVDESGDVLTAAVDELRAGPTPEEAGVGLTTAIPRSEGKALSSAALAQLVYTLTQLSGADSTEVNGTSYDRGDFEDLTPAILVESPLPFEEVTTPLRVTGTANTFEATFEYELRDSAGKVVDSNFVTATSGTGTRGTFDFTTKAVDDVASLVVFERSAQDGSRIHEVEIPLETR